MTMLLGPDGLPINRTALSTEIAGATMTGVRTAWRDSVAAGLTPHRVAQILRAADQGEGMDYLTLAEEMEERESQYGTVLGIRKRTIQGLPIQIDAASDDPEDVAIADAVRDLFAAPEFLACIGDLLDALGKGYSVVEMLWETTAHSWKPVEYIWRDPRFFQVDRLTGRKIRLRVDGSIDGEPLAPYKFIAHIPRLKSGLPLRGGLARFAIWAFLFKTYSLRDWASFLETYGSPMRLGKYGAAASVEDQRKLLKAVRDIAADAAAIIPDTMIIDFISADKSGGGTGGAVFSAFIDHLDGAIAKIVLGQTLTTDKGANRAQAQVHDGVRKDVATSDANTLAMTLKRDIVIPFVSLNYGPRPRYPNVSLVLADNADIAVMADALQKLVPLGLKVQSSEVRDALGFSDPAQNAEILQPPAQPAAAPALNRFNCACCGDDGIALNRSGAEMDELDRLGSDYAADWEPQIGPMLKPILDAVAKAKSLEEIKAMLPDLYEKMDSGALEQRLGSAAAIARGLGSANGQGGGGQNQGDGGEP